ncbi:hypothetical protein KQI82_02315 [Oscillibacter sp. MSJ-2]|uniref:Uncharacterized protein n=1 Tax=Dysosmobacter acutus TaxID=2841504 RepID=A0ABS6F6T5_9FIRM|nr:hypothetical protein [Dysosmobacter acutus]MBU5625768.1 hypothetical protein [Dysosmobacter acutus]
MPDYKKLYLDLMYSSEQAIRMLIEAQKRCEDAVLSEAVELTEEERDRI